MLRAINGVLRLQIFGFLRQLPLRTQLLSAFIVPAIAIMLSALAVYMNLEMAMKHSQQVEHSVRAIALRGELLRTVLDAETGERGYVITGNPDFLKPYQYALNEFSQLTGVWRELAAESELQQLDKIEDLFSQWLNNVARPVIEARQQAPGRLVSRGFDALYHISFLGDVLRGRAELPDEETAEFVDELQENMNVAARSAQITSQADEWALAARNASRLRTLYRDAFATPQDSYARARALNLIADLFLTVRDLTHIAVEAEDSAVNIISSGEGKALTDQIRAEIARSVSIQKNHFDELTSRTHKQMRIAEWAAIILPIVGVSLGGGITAPHAL